MSFHGEQRLGQPVHQREAVRQPRERVVQDLVGQGFLSVDLCCYIAGDPESTDDLAALVPERHFRARHPGVPSDAVGLPFHLPHERLAGADNLLLVLIGISGVLVAEEIEVRLPDYLLRGQAGGARGDPACADQEEPASQVLEVHALLGSGQQVAHAGELELTQWSALLPPL